MNGSWYGGSQRSSGSISSGGFSNAFPVMHGGRLRGGSSRSSSMSSLGPVVFTLPFR